MDRNKIVKMVVILAAIVVIATSLSRVIRKGSMSIREYASLQGDSQTSDPAKYTPAATGVPEETASPDRSAQPSPKPAASPSTPAPADDASSPGASVPEDKSPSSKPSAPEDETPSPGPSAPPTATPAPAQLTGASLNGTSQLQQRVLLEEGFYYEPLSDNLRRYITGVSYPASVAEGDLEEPEISLEDLRYLHILHYNFEGLPTEGELICNVYIAQDLAEIFYELYCSEYQLEKVLLIDEYDGDDNASMEDNNTSCFNYRPVEGSTRLSKHALGLAVDINPLYNPYITYEEDGSEKAAPASAAAYADRSLSFPYKIDEEDLCYKLFTQHGFTWGGHWNNVKDYQHFQKTR